MIDISEDCAGSTAGAVPVASASPAIGAGSGDSIGRGVNNASGVEGVEMAFEFSGVEGVKMAFKFSKILIIRTE